MKKAIVLASIAITALSFLPASAHAKQCEVVSGDGKSFGSEVACGDEHFYIFDHDESAGTVRALAKYNLNTRTIIHRVDIEPISDAGARENYCKNIANQNGGWIRFDNFYGKNDPNHCFYEKNLEGDIIQNKDAVSAHWDNNGNYAYPQIGDVYPILYFVLDPRDHLSGTVTADFNYPTYDHTKYDGTQFYDFDVKLEPYTEFMLKNDPIKHGNQLGSALYSYNNTLLENGYDIRGTDLLSLDDLNTVAESHNKSIPYADWLANRGSSYSGGTALASLLDYLDESESWLYDRTYWLKTGVRLSSDYDELSFVNQRGDFCTATTRLSQIDNSACSYAVLVNIGAGVRPLVTMSDDFIIHSSDDEPVPADESDKKKVPVDNPATLDQIDVYAAMVAIFAGILLLYSFAKKKQKRKR